MTAYKLKDFSAEILWQGKRGGRGVDKIYEDENLSIMSIECPNPIERPEKFDLFVEVNNPTPNSYQGGDGRRWTISHRQGWMSSDDLEVVESEDAGHGLDYIDVDTFRLDDNERHGATHFVVVEGSMDTGETVYGVFATEEEAYEALDSPEMVEGNTRVAQFEFAHILKREA